MMKTSFCETKKIKKEFVKENKPINVHTNIVYSTVRKRYSCKLFRFSHYFFFFFLKRYKYACSMFDPIIFVLYI